MHLKKPYLLAELNVDEIRPALAEWSWLLEGEEWKPLCVSAAGDVFLRDSIGAVFRLDTGIAELQKIASSLDLFEQQLANSELVADWFLEPVVEQLRVEGKILVKAQCYGFTVLPIFKEGSYKAENRIVLPASEHICLSAAVHKQVRHLPDGSKVEIKPSEWLHNKWLHGDRRNRCAFSVPSLAFGGA